VAFRWYEPPPRDGTAPLPILESAIFAVAFGVLFALLGWVVSTVGGVAEPYGRLSTLALVPVGLYAAYAGLAGRFDDRSDVGRLMGTVAGVVVGLYPLVLFPV